MFTQNTVTVVTAATGHHNLVKCLASVQQQTYGPVEHFVVIDGPERETSVREAMSKLGQPARPVHVIGLPYATGRENWCGHRIYGATAFLVNSEFIAFLDEDNWFEPDHVESLVSAVRATQSQWAFSLRNIVDADGQFIAPDNCESLGNLHHVYHTPAEVLIDTNCYLLPREVAARFAYAWYRPNPTPADELEADRLLCRALLQHCPRACSNRRHTVNYLLGTRPGGLRGDFFLRGNQLMQARYPQGLPWEPK
jgi:glycosyltransferase involved in cell wall biosynthesis